MKFCKNCGQRIDDNSIFCQYCGAQVNGDTHQYGNTGNPFGNPYGGYPVYDTSGSKLVAFVSFLFWQVGVILYIMWRRTRPGKAQSAAKGAIASACVSMPILGLVFWLVWREELDKKELAKVAGISAIIGTAFYALLVILSVLGLNPMPELPDAVNQGTAAFISLIG